MVRSRIKTENEHEEANADAAACFLLDLVTLTTEGLMKPRFKSYNLSSRQSRQDGLSQTGASQPTEKPRMIKDARNWLQPA